MGNVPKLSHNVNEQIRPGGKAFFDAEALAIKSHLNNRSLMKKDEEVPVTNGQAAIEEEINNKKRNWGRYDSSALHIQHALKQTEVQKNTPNHTLRPSAHFWMKKNSGCWR